MCFCSRRRVSAHHVRARTPRFACGGDDYLFILFDGISQVRAISPPAPARLPQRPPQSPRRAAAVGMSHERAVLLTRAQRPWASQVVDCCSLRAAIGSWGGM